MKKSSILIAGCGALLLASALTIASGTSERPATRTSPAVPQASADNQHIVPDAEVYGFLFRRVALMSERMRAVQAAPQANRAPQLPLQREASLTEAQTRALEAIALACQQEIDQLDERARIITRAFSDRYPSRTVPQGERLAPPPPELGELMEERKAAILRARDRLRAAFGEQEFARLDALAKFRYGSFAAPLAPNPSQP